jgi:predicted DCC family thiol-disulfide oxidoreductase YuxK
MKKKMSNKPIIIFDSECTLCTRFKDGLERIDINNELSFISIHSPEVNDLDVSLSAQEIQATIHLITEDNKVLKGSDVITHLSKILPGIKKLSWLLETNVGKKASNFFYEKINQMRLAKTKECKGCKKHH